MRSPTGRDRRLGPRNAGAGKARGQPRRRPRLAPPLAPLGAMRVECGRSRCNVMGTEETANDHRLSRPLHDGARAA